jgi:hypothetical protein
VFSTPGQMPDVPTLTGMHNAGKGRAMGSPFMEKGTAAQGPLVGSGFLLLSQALRWPADSGPTR